MKERNKNYQLKDLQIGDRFQRIESNSKTVYQIIGRILRPGDKSLKKISIQNSDSGIESNKDPELVVRYLRSTADPEQPTSTSGEAKEIKAADVYEFIANQKKQAEEEDHD